MRSIALIGLLVAGGCHSGPCDLEGTILDKAAPGTPQTCGNLSIGATDQERMDARDCFVAAMRGHRLAMIEWDVQGIDSHVARGYLHDDNDASFAFDYDGNPSGSGGDKDPHVVTSECAGGLVATPSCTSDELARTLCFACDAKTERASCP
jgi:hypothetical protein